METKLTSLAKEYKKTKSDKVLNDIFKELEEPLRKKANFVYYSQRFVKSKFSTNDININTKKREFKNKVKTFKLKDVRGIEIEDIQQELYLQVLLLLKNYNTKSPFDNYLFGTLKKWRPSFLRENNFIKDLDTIREDKLFNEDDCGGINILGKSEESAIEILDFFEPLTDEEEKYIQLKIKNPNLKKSEIEKRLGITPTNLNKLIKNIKNKTLREE